MLPQAKTSYSGEHNHPDLLRTNKDEQFVRRVQGDLVRLEIDVGIPKDLNGE
jgi:hypothetical protein